MSTNTDSIPVISAAITGVRYPRGAFQIGATDDEAMAAALAIIFQAS